MKNRSCIPTLCQLLIITTIFSQNVVNSYDFDVVVDMTATVGKMRRIWDNTGLSPPGPGEEAVNYLGSKEQILNLALIGSLPFKGIVHVRIHWLLDLVKFNLVLRKFDYELLDQLIGWLRKHRLRPSFELMGNPGNVFSDLNSNPDTLFLWKYFMTDLATHYIEKYGKDEVSKWRFELWNEPNSEQYNILNLTTVGYMKYAEASMKGLGVHDLRVSGPAGTFKDFTHHNISWSLLEMCNTMIAVSGRCDLDTITFHKKGEGSAQHVISSSAEFYSLVTTLYPLLKSLPFANNEADILSGWWREEEWRGDVNYAAQVIEVITVFLAEVFKQRNFTLSYLSNDNGFINQLPAYFNQRTLLTRFQMNSSEDGHSQFVRKPVLVAMALLSYIGSEEMPVFLRDLSCSSDCDSRLSALAAGDGTVLAPGWSGAVVVAISALTPNCTDKSLELRLRVPDGIEFKYVVYQLDNVLTNPRNIWELSGKPPQPDFDLLNHMREHEGPYLSQEGSVVGEWEMLTLQARCPSVFMVHLCTKPRTYPAKILQLHAVNVTFNEVLLLWQDSDTKCVKTYEIFFCASECLSDDNYQMITDKPVLMLSYQFRANSGISGDEQTRGRYKVRVRNYWDLLSAFSDVLVYP